MNPVNIVLVEDDDGHARLGEKNLRRAGLWNPISRSDGESAVQYLFAAMMRAICSSCSISIFPT